METCSSQVRNGGGYLAVAARYCRTVYLFFLNELVVGCYCIYVYILLEGKF